MIRRHRPGACPHRRPRGHAYTVIELMLIVAILGILGSVVIDVGWRAWRREQVNSVVVELAGWLQSVRRGALKGNRCMVTLAPSATPHVYASGDSLAQVSPCGTVQPLRLRGHSSGAQRFEVRLLHATTSDGATGFTFTPAGTISPAPAVDDPPIVITVALRDHPDSGRCLRLDGLLGALDVGVPDRPGGDDCVVGGGF